jgi:hypothetical protein
VSHLPEQISLLNRANSDTAKLISSMSRNTREINIPNASSRRSRICRRQTSVTRGPPSSDIRRTHSDHGVGDSLGICSQIQSTGLTRRLWTTPRNDSIRQKRDRQLAALRTSAVVRVSFAFDQFELLDERNRSHPLSRQQSDQPTRTNTLATFASADKQSALARASPLVHSVNITRLLVAALVAFVADAASHRHGRRASIDGHRPSACESGASTSCRSMHGKQCSRSSRCRSRAAFVSRLTFVRQLDRQC